MLPASYGGDNDLQASTSTPLNYTVGKGAAVVQPSISTGASIPYGPYSVNATGAGAAAGLPVPTGSISYVIDGGALISVPGALVNGSITFQLPQTPVGVHTIGFGYSGDSNYAATPNDVVPTSLYIPFTITPAALTVTANSLTGVYGQALPMLTDTITGFVFTDTVASAVTGTPALATTATSTSAPGSYPVTVAKGTLAAANYSFNFVPDTLQISQAAQTVTFTPIANQIYGAAAFAVSATATSGLPATIAVQSGPATIANNQVTVNGVGTVVLVANQAGNADYSAAASATASFTIAPASTNIAVNVTSNVIRTPNPISLSATLSSAVSGATGTVTFLDGTTTLGQTPLTSADTAALNGVTLAIGTHNITARYSGATDFAASTSPVDSVTVEPLAIVLSAIAPVVAVAGTSDTRISATGANFSPTAAVNFNGTSLATTFVSTTQLTAVIPAALLANTGSISVTVTDTYSSSASQPQTFTILPVTSVTFTGPPSTNPGDQMAPVNFSLQQAYPVTLVGTMTLTFTPDPGNPNNPQVQFATGGTTFAFTLPPNTTETPLILLQAGTTSGTIIVSLQLTASGINVNPPNLSPISITVPKVAPTVSAVSFSASGDTLTVVVTGFSSTREIQSATFSFTPAMGASLAEKKHHSSRHYALRYLVHEPRFRPIWQHVHLYAVIYAFRKCFGGRRVGVTLTNSVGTSTEVTSP